MEKQKTEADKSDLMQELRFAKTQQIALTTAAVGLLGALLAAAKYFSPLSAWGKAFFVACTAAIWFGGVVFMVSLQHHLIRTRLRLDWRDWRYWSPAHGKSYVRWWHPRRFWWPDLGRAPEAAMASVLILTVGAVIVGDAVLYVSPTVEPQQTPQAGKVLPPCGTGVSCDDGSSSPPGAHRADPAAVTPAPVGLDRTESSTSGGHVGDARPGSPVAVPTRHSRRHRRPQH